MSSVSLRALCAFVLLGLCTTLAQIVVLREYLVNFHGNELSIGLILALWLFGHGMGSLVADWLRCSSISGLARYLTLATFAPLSFLPLAEILIGVLAPEHGHLVPLSSILGGAVLLVVPLAAALGVIFPWMCSLCAGIHGASSPRDISAFYLSDAVGSALGGALSTFVIAPYLTPYHGCALAGSGLALSAALLVHGRKEHRRLCSLVLAVSLLLGCGVMVTGPSLEWARAQRRFEKTFPGLELVARRDTPYQLLELGLGDSQHSLFGDGQYYFSFPDRATVAQEAHLAMLCHRCPRDVLVLGGGLNGFLEEIRVHGLEQVTYVELDEQLISFLDPYLPESDKSVLTAENVQVVAGDGRRWLEQCPNESQDMVLVRLPEPSSAMLNRYYTREFYEIARRKLRDDGVLLTTSSGSANYLGEELSAYLGTRLATLEGVFERVAVLPGFSTIFIAGKRSAQVTWDIDTLTRRWNERAIQSPYFSAVHLRLQIDPSRVAAFEALRRGLPRDRPNLDADPATYYYNIILWDTFSDSGMSALFGYLATYSVVSLIGVILSLTFLAVLLSSFLGSTARVSRTRLAGAMVASGAGAMIFHVLMLLAYQNLFGSLYEKMGVAVAVFMVGLVLGGSVARRIISTEIDGVHWMMVASVVACTFALTVPSFLSVLAGVSRGLGELCFLAFLLFGAALVGFQYPLACLVGTRFGLSVRACSSVVYGGDMLGGAVGAAVSALVLVPLVGFSGTAYVLCALHLSGAMFAFSMRCGRQVRVSQ